MRRVGAGPVAEAVRGAAGPTRPTARPRRRRGAGPARRAPGAPAGRRPRPAPPRRPRPAARSAPAGAGRRSPPPAAGPAAAWSRARSPARAGRRRRRTSPARAGPTGALRGMASATASSTWRTTCSAVGGVVGAVGAGPASIRTRSSSASSSGAIRQLGASTRRARTCRPRPAAAPSSAAPREQPDAGVDVVAGVRLGQHRQRRPDRQADGAPLVGELDHALARRVGRPEGGPPGDGHEAHAVTSDRRSPATLTPADRQADARFGSRGRRITLAGMSILNAKIARLDGTPATLGDITGGRADPAGQRREPLRPHPPVHRTRGAPARVRRPRLHRRRGPVQPVRRSGARLGRGDRRVLLGDVRRHASR